MQPVGRSVQDGAKDPLLQRAAIEGRHPRGDALEAQGSREAAPLLQIGEAQHDYSGLPNVSA